MADKVFEEVTELDVLAGRVEPAELDEVNKVMVWLVCELDGTDDLEIDDDVLIGRVGLPVTETRELESGVALM